MTQWSHKNVISMAIHEQDCDGKEDWKRSCCKKVVNKYSAGTVSVLADNLNSFDQCRRHQKMAGREATLASTWFKLKIRLTSNEPHADVNQ